MDSYVEIVGLRGEAGPCILWIAGHIQVIVQDTDQGCVDVLPRRVQGLDNVLGATLSASCPNTFSKPRDAEYVFLRQGRTTPTSPTYTFRTLSSFLVHGREELEKNESSGTQQEVQEREDGHSESRSDCRR